MKNTIFAFVLVSIALLPTGCNQTDEHENTPASFSDQQKIDPPKNDHQIHGNSKEDFLKHLNEGKELYSFFSDNWTLTYGADTRAGAMKGEVTGLAKNAMDKTIKIKVNSDGRGWDCEEGEDGDCDPYDFEMDFNLKERLGVSGEDRFKISNSEKEGVVVISGTESFEVLTLHYNNDNLIVKIELYEQDPG